MPVRPFQPVPDWISWENQGANVAIADLNRDGTPDILVLRVDAPPDGPNAAFYKVGSHLDAQGNVQAWSPWLPIPDWNSNLDEGAGLAVADFGVDGLGLVVLQVRGRGNAAPNNGRYRVGRGLDAQGRVQGGWSAWQDVPDWRSFRDQGAAIAVADLDNDGNLEVVIFHIDDFHSDHQNPGLPNKGFYRVGRKLSTDGQVAAWGDWKTIDWESFFNQGGGVALADLDNNGQLDLIIFQIDNPLGENNGKYRVGWNIDVQGNIQDGWGPWFTIDGWDSWEDAGGGLALATFAVGQRPKAVVLHVDNPRQLNSGRYYVLDLVLDIDQAATNGVWRLLPYFSEVLPVHAALLHTGNVLFFAGSGNNVFRFESHEFGSEADKVYTSVVWDPIKNTFAHPPTLRRSGPNGRPIDFFCCGHCFLPDGRLLVAGGTDEYDKIIQNGVMVDAGHSFFGIPDAMIFDPAPASGRWKAIKPMAHGRWYPTLLLLSDGRVMAAAGLDENGNSNEILESNPAPDHAAWSKARDFALPQYPHLFLLRDGRLFYTGGKMDTKGSSDPLLFDPLQPTASVLVKHLRDTDRCNQSASVILPPAQDQKVMILGGGPEDETEATDRVDIIDFTEPNPRYRPGPRLAFDRMHVNAVLLPDQTVLAVGGGGTREASAGGVIAPQAVRERLVAERFDLSLGAKDRWKQMAAAQVPRLYHSVALLLPDGRVVAAGGNPDKGSQINWLPPDPLEEMRLEIYSPPYLFKKDQRPVITAVPEEMTYGDTITIRSPQASEIKWIDLIRPGLTTHSFNCEQRLVDMPFNVVSEELRATVTDDRNVAPPGWYMLFLVDNDGVPSVATWIHLQ